MCRSLVCSSVPQQKEKGGGVALLKEPSNKNEDTNLICGASRWDLFDSSNWPDYGHLGGTYLLQFKICTAHFKKGYFLFMVPFGKLRLAFICFVSCILGDMFMVSSGLYTYSMKQCSAAAELTLHRYVRITTFARFAVCISSLCRPPAGADFSSCVFLFVR